MKKYKRFFKVPLNRLPWRLPLKKKKKEEEPQTLRNIPRSHPGKFSTYQSANDIDQRIILEILKIIRQRRYRDLSQSSAIPIVYITSTRAGKAGFFSYTTSYENLDSPHQIKQESTQFFRG